MPDEHAQDPSSTRARRLRCMAQHKRPARPPHPRDEDFTGQTAEGPFRRPSQANSDWSEPDEDGYPEDDYR